MARFLAKTDETYEEHKRRLFGTYPYFTWCEYCLKRLIDEDKAVLQTERDDNGRIISEAIFCNDDCAKAYRIDNIGRKKRCSIKNLNSTN